MKIHRITLLLCMTTSFFSKPLGMVFLGGKLGIPRYLFVRQTKLSQIVPSFFKVDMLFYVFSFPIFKLIILVLVNCQC